MFIFPPVASDIKNIFQESLSHDDFLNRLEKTPGFLIEFFATVSEKNWATSNPELYNNILDRLDTLEFSKLNKEQIKKIALVCQNIFPAINHNINGKIFKLYTKSIELDNVFDLLNEISIDNPLIRECLILLRNATKQELFLEAGVITLNVINLHYNHTTRKLIHFLSTLNINRVKICLSIGPGFFNVNKSKQWELLFKFLMEFGRNLHSLSLLEVSLNEKSIAEIMKYCLNLKELTISNPKILQLFSLPNTLKILDCRNCTALTRLPEKLPDSLERLDCRMCYSLKKFPSKIPLGLSELYWFHSLDKLKQLIFPVIEKDPERGIRLAYTSNSLKTPPFIQKISETLPLLSSDELEKVLKELYNKQAIINWIPLTAKLALSGSESSIMHTSFAEYLKLFKELDDDEIQDFANEFMRIIETFQLNPNYFISLPRDRKQYFINAIRNYIACVSAKQRIEDSDLAKDIFYTLQSIDTDDIDNKLRLIPNNSLTAFFQTPFGAVILFSNLHKIHHTLETPRLKKWLFKICPSSNPKNLSFYPLKISKSFDTVLIKISPSMPLVEPDAIFDQLFALFENSAGYIRKLEVSHYGSPGSDYGGLGRQFVSQVIQGIITKSEYYQFTKLTDGSFLTKNENPAKTSSAEIERFKYLGMFFGLAAKCRYPLGEIFNIGLFTTIMSFSSRDLDGTFQSYLESMTNAKLLEKTTPLVDAHDLIVKKYYDNFAIILSKNREPSAIIEAANFIAQVFNDDKLDLALKDQDLRAIQYAVRNIFADLYKGPLELMHAMAQGLREMLPFDLIIDNSLIEFEEWYELAFITPKRLQEALQGKLDKEFLKQNLEITANYFQQEGVSVEQKNLDDVKIGQVRQWLIEWIDDVKDPDLIKDMERIRLFIQTCTGARSLAGKIFFNLSPAAKGLFSHTCNNFVDIPLDIKKDTFMIALDLFGSGEMLSFNTA